MSSIRKARNLYSLMKSQWKPYDELREIQNKKLKAIVKHAYENVPFYREKFTSFGVNPDEIKTVDDLPKIPITTKQEARDNYPGKIVARGVDLKKCWLPHTSGSSGMPLYVVYDEVTEDYEKALALRPNLTCGQGLFDKWVVVTSPLDIIERKPKWFQRFGLFHTIDVSMMADLDEQISIITREKPDVIDGYSSALFILAQEVSRRGLEIRPKLVFSTGELLAKEEREAINAAFGVKMFDQFGCVELSRTAWECPAHNGYHMDAESGIMEFLRDGKPVKPGERGEITYTNLYNYAMPFIRYSVGDIGIPSDEKCSCGRGLPMMKVIEGRNNSLVRLPGGRMLPSLSFWSIMGMFSERDSISKFRVIQDKLEEIRIQIVPKGEFTGDTANLLVKHVAQSIGSEVNILIEPVDDIPRDKSGKIHSVISKVGIDWDSAS